MNNFKKKTVFIPVISVVLIASVWTIIAITSKPVYKTTKASLLDFSQEVSVTGSVAAADDVSLGFETGGKVAGIPVSVGSKVTKGTTLAYVGGGDLYATLLNRQSALQAEQARLASVVRGARPEELAIVQTTYDQSKNNIQNTISDAFIKSDNAVRNSADTLFTNPTSVNPEIIYFSESNLPSEFRKTLNTERLRVGEILSAWSVSILEAQTKGYNDTYLTSSKSNLTTIQNFFNDLTLAVNSLRVGDNNLSQATIDTYKANISSGRTSISSAISSLNSAELTYRGASDQLALKKAGSSLEDLDAEQAAVRSAEANVLLAQAQLNNTIISAPFDGVVTKTNLKVGQLVSANTSVVSMISNANFQIESFIPEADIAKVKVGDVGTTTLDAYGDSVTFPVVVTAIDLSDTQVDGVATYKTTLQFVSSDDRVRSGMTANIDIVSDTRKGVLAVPQSAVVSKSGIKTVLVMDNKGKTSKRIVTTGNLDSKSNIEIKSGLVEGDTVVTNPPKK
ncbi:MAG: efflux RND transporter periplasmic adaptor subunit [Candidatus Paceibacterota bacterium]